MTEIEQFAELLRAQMQKGLPGVQAHRIMAPSSRPVLSFAEENYPEAKKAGVLVLCFPDIMGISTVLMQRTVSGGTHSGQVSFPGGRIEAFDSGSSAAALRETEEEIGVAPSLVHLVGKLSDIYIPPSNFFVFPWLGYALQKPAFRPEGKEVDALIEMPLEILLDPDRKGVDSLQRGEDVIRAPFYEIASHHVWGATAIILSEIEFLLRAINYPVMLR